MGENKGHILVVEPNDVTRKLIVGILTARGYGAFEAASGDAALAFLGKRPALAIVDVDHEDPSITGLLHKLKKDHGRLPLVAMSEAEDTRELAARIGMAQVSVLSKPVVPAALLQNIEAHLISGVEQGMDPQGQPPKADLPAPAPGTEEARAGFMRRALDLAQQKMDETRCGPFAAVIVRGGRIVAEGWDCSGANNDPTAHAEMEAIRAAARETGGATLEGCELYTTCEPCPMCLAAAYWAKVDRVFYAATREEAHAAGFDHEYIHAEITAPEHKRSLPSKMILHDEGRIVFADWLKMAGGK